MLYNDSTCIVGNDKWVYYFNIGLFNVFVWLQTFVRRLAIISSCNWELIRIQLYSHLIDMVTMEKQKMFKWLLAILTNFVI